MKQNMIIIWIVVFAIYTTVWAADDTSYSSLHTVSTEITSALDSQGNVQNTTFTVKSFRDRYHANDPRTMCNMRIGPDSCPFGSASEANLSFYSISNYRPTKFRIYLPPGTTKLNFNLRYTQSAEARAAIRADSPPVTTDPNTPVNSDPTSNLSNLLAGQEIIAKQADGTMQIFGVQVPLSSPLATGRWIYINVIDTKQASHSIFKIDGIITVKASTYIGWFNTCQFDSLGNVLFAGASSAGTAPCEGVGNNPPEEVDIDLPGSMTIAVGDSIAVSVLAGVATKFTSADPTIASVNASTGVVTGVKQGTTTITVQGVSADNTDTMTVTVEAQPPIDLPGAATAGVNQTITIIPLQGQAVEYTSSNSSVASVTIDGNGNASVVGKTEGTTIITGTDADGNSDSTTVTVIPEPALDIPANKTVQIGKSSTVSPTAGTVVTCTSTDETIVTVSVNNNIINLIGITEGTTDVVCEDASGAQDTISVSVVEVASCTGDECLPPECSNPITSLTNPDCQSTPATTNTAPTASNVTVSVELGQSVDITLLGVDADGDGLTYTVTTQPEKGSLTGVTPNLTYKANSSVGTDSFQYKVFDGTESSGEATVTITIMEKGDESEKGFNLSPVTGVDFNTGEAIPEEELTDITFFGGAMKNGIYTKSVELNQVVDVKMFISVAPEDVGMQAEFYVFVAFNKDFDNFILLTSEHPNGWAPWTGTFYAYKGTKTLVAEEELALTPEGLTTDTPISIQIFAGYKVLPVDISEDISSDVAEDTIDEQDGNGIVEETVDPDTTAASPDVKVADTKGEVKTNRLYFNLTPLEIEFVEPQPQECVPLPPFITCSE